MRIQQSLTICAAAVRIPFRSIRKVADAAGSIKPYKLASTLVRTGIFTAAMALSFVHYAAAQETVPLPDPAATPQSNDDAQCNSCENPAAIIGIPNPNPIMGFESLKAWTVQWKGVSPGFNITSTTLRTEGKAALAVVNPPAQIALTSLPIDHRTKALAGIGNSGALVLLDFRVQPNNNRLAAADPEIREAVTSGSIQGFVSVKSLGLNHVALGQALLRNHRAGIYNTLSFSVPESLSSALKGASFSDLEFTFEITAPHAIQGAFIFDNLRVHSVALVQSPEGIAPPAGYGGSLNLSVVGSKPVTQSFALTPTQIPSGFHLAKGTAGTTTVQLQLGLDSTPELTCAYAPDTTDKTNESYILQSCTNGYVAGDLVNSNWVSLGILQALSSQQLRAQLSLNPLGSLSGSGLLPPMPTYWGSSDRCTPTPVKGKVATVSSSCAAQTASANKIVTQYFNKVNSENPSPGWVVAPVPQSALRIGNGAPLTVLGNPSAPANDLPFSTGGDLNPGGSFDAYWSLSGDLTPTAVAGTDENLTHFDAAFTTHGVLFGDDIDVVDAKVTADTDSGETTPSYKPAKSSGTLGFYVFGEEIPSGGLSFDPSTNFNVDPSWTQEYDLPSIQIWIFDITLGALVDADLKASGSAALAGADLSVVPTVSLGGHISGGINLGIAEGNVDAKVNLVTLSAPMSAQAKWVLDTRPAVCAATLNGSLKGDLDLGSGGGEVDLDATFGVCPFCYTDSYTLVKWNSLVSKSWNLFNDTIDLQLFGLPAAMCKYPINVKILSPTSGTTLSSGLPITLTGSGTPNDTTLPYTTTYSWTYTKGAHASTVTVNPAGANTANPTVTFGPPTSGTTSTWTIGLTATTTVQSAGGTTLKQTATATPVTVKVTSIQPGVYISQVSSSNNGPAIPDPTTGVLDVGNIPGIIYISGVVSGGTGTLNTVFTITPCNESTPACTSPGTTTTLPVTGAATATPQATWSGFGGGFFKVIMTTTSGATTIGTTTVDVFGTVLF